jgi:glycolate oxidase FAD binding subunit
MSSPGADAGARILRPASDAELRDIVAASLADAAPLEVAGAGTKRAIGRPAEAARRLETGGMTGVTLYEPEELVMSARAGTRVAEIEATLAQRGQMLAFEPPDLARLLGGEIGHATIGGAFGCNLSGPRRVKSGAARDHILGFRAVSGRGESFKAGGRVVKNVTGYDLAKLIAGSYGTLAVMGEVTFKVLPLPEAARTLLVLGADAAGAVRAMADALNSPNEVSGAAHLPREVAALAGVAAVAEAGTSVTAIRIEGFGPSVAARLAALKELLRDHRDLAELSDGDTKALWRAVGEVAPFAPATELGLERCVWRLSIAPANAAGIAASVPGAHALYDWGGGRVWLAVPARPEEDAHAPAVRAAAAAAGGHAVLVRAPDAVRRSVPPFPPQPAALAQLTSRVKAAFDPGRILNPGRMYEGV